MIGNKSVVATGSQIIEYITDHEKEFILIREIVGGFGAEKKIIS